MWIIDTFPSLQRRFRQPLPHFSFCYEGNIVAVSAFVETGSSQLIRIAIWRRDVRIVVLTVSFFLANLAGLFYGEDPSISHLAIDVFRFFYL